MELTKQVSSLELCKKLKELGWDKETLFYYVINLAIKEKDPVHGKLKFYSDTRSYHLFKRVESGGCILYIPAPTVAELGEAIGEKGLLKFWNNFPKENTKGLFENLFDLLTNPNVVCNMWIYLKEKNLL